eukprot:761032-Hanusia_phi.AAC.11
MKKEGKEGQEAVNVFSHMKQWTVRYRTSADVDYGISTDICKIFAEAAELVEHVRGYSMREFAEIEADPRFQRYQSDGIMGDEPGYWTSFDVAHDDEWRANALSLWHPGVCLVEREDGEISVKLRRSRAARREKSSGGGSEEDDAAGDDDSASADKDGREGGEGDGSEMAERNRTLMRMKSFKSSRRKPLIKTPFFHPSTAYWVCHFTRKVFAKTAFYSDCSPGSPSRSRKHSSTASTPAAQNNQDGKDALRDSAHFIFFDAMDLEADKFSTAPSRTSSHNRGARGSISSIGLDQLGEQIVSESAQQELFQDYEEAYQQDLQNLFSPAPIACPPPEENSGEVAPEEARPIRRRERTTVQRVLLRPTRVMFDTSQRCGSAAWLVEEEKLSRGRENRDVLRPSKKSEVSRRRREQTQESIDDLIALYAQLKKGSNR